jgi:hypothetical protein
MKMIKKYIVVALLLMTSSLSYAQGINFQGVARSANGTIIAGSNISLRLSILSKSVDATPEFIETKTVVTNTQGIFSIVVGDASNVAIIGSFKTINWTNAPKFLKVEMDPSGGTNYLSMGITQLQYVPYSFYSLGVDAVNVAGILPVKSGGTGVASISDLKITLAIDKVNNTADLDKPISILTQSGLDAKLNKDDTSSLSNRINNNLSQIVILKNKSSYIVDSIGNIGFGVNALSKTQFRKDSTGVGFIATNANILPQNIAIGDSALLQNTSGAFNIAIGTKSLSKITTSVDNTALGFASLLNLTSLNGGSANTALGTTTLMNNQNGNGNVAIGSGSMEHGITGNSNSAVGVESLIENRGDYNSALGVYTLHSNTTGNNNTAIGTSAGYSNLTGNVNTFIGNGTNVSTGNISNATAIGNGAIVMASNTIQLGNSSITDVKTNGTILAAGFKIPNGTSAQYLKADGSVATSVTAGVPYSGAIQAVDLGPYDLKVNGITIGVGAKTITSTNTIDNTAIGNGVLINNRTGLANTANGFQALQNNTTGSSNTAIGALTLLYNTTGGNNTATGIGAIYNNTIGSNNTATGLSASYRNTTGDNNTSNGFEALQTNSTGSNNTAFGYRADVASANLTNATAIGNGAIVNASNTIQLGNTSVTSVVTSGTIKSNGMISNLVSKTSAYTVQTSDEIITVDATSSTFAITLPTAVGIAGQTFTIKRLNAGVNSVSIGTTSSQAIDGATSWVLNAQYKYLKVVSNGANWIIVANN